MRDLISACHNEFLKARRSPVSLVTILGSLMVPTAGAFFMLVAKYPEQAKNLGIMSAKAQLLGVEVSWRFYYGFLLQAVAVGGIIMFSFISAWVFGREYINKTQKDLLALPTSRTTIVTAKLLVVGVWSLTLALLMLGGGIVLGLLIKLPGWSTRLLLDNSLRLVVSAVMAILLAWVVAWVANLTRSYFSPIGLLVFAVAFGQIASALGWGAYFPWAIPAIYSNPATTVALGPASFIIVVATGIAGVAGTVLWWRFADQAG